MKFALLDVGHGSCAVATSGAEAVVVDCPPGDGLTRYLRENGVSIVRDLVLSHSDKDHCGGVPALLKSGIRIGTLWINNDQNRDSQAYEALAVMFDDAHAQELKIGRGYPHSGQPSIVWSDFVFEFMAPLGQDMMRAPINSNRTSVVVRVARQDGHGIALLTADVDKIGFERVLNYEPRNYQADWLTGPHHGGLAASTPDASAELLQMLLEVTGATNVFFSLSRGKSENRPRPEIMADLRTNWLMGGANAVRCSQVSTQCCTLPSQRQDTFHIRTSDGMLKGRVHSCAGTVVLDSENGYTWTSAQAHDAFKTTLTSPQCAKGFDPQAAANPVPAS